MATFDTIVEAAAQVLEAHGLEGYNTNAVAARAGVSIGSLYQYFPHKDAISAALIEREQAHRVAHLTALSQRLSGEPLFTIVDALVDAVVAGERERPRLSACVDQEEARLAVNGIVNAAGEKLDAALAALLRAYHPDSSVTDLSRGCRTLRVAIRAVIDDALNRPVPDESRARSEAAALAHGYLARLAA